MLRRLELRFASTVLFVLSLASIIFAADAAAPEKTIEQLAQVQPALPQIPDRDYKLTDFGGVGDGKTWNSDAFNAAIAKIKQDGGGRLIVPHGVFLTKPFALCSQLDLHLDQGAIIQAPTTFTDYGLPEPETLKSQDEVKANVRAPPPLITGKDLHDVALTGSGVIDGAGANWWAWSERASRREPGRLIYPRMNLVVIDGCQRLRAEGITFRNSPKFHFVPTNVTDLLIEGVKVQAPEDAPNTDAIDPTSCTKVLIRNCDIDTGDDDIVIKTGGKGILIEDCRIRHGHGISIGSGTTGGIRDMLVRRSTFENTDNGIRIKSMRGAGGPVEHIRYTDIQMKDVKNAIVLDLTYTDNNRPDFRGDPNKVPRIDDVEISNVTIDGAQNAGRFVGLPDSPIGRVTLRNVTLTADKDFVQKDADSIVFENCQRTINKKPTKRPAEKIE
jgi:polygalacturonase